VHATLIEDMAVHACLFNRLEIHAHRIRSQRGSSSAGNPAGCEPPDDAINSSGNTVLIRACVLDDDSRRLGELQHKRTAEPDV
jgi:hypothetical protein